MQALTVPAEILQPFVSRLFAAADVPPADADRVAECLVLADLRGIASHGVSRVTIYLERLRLGLVNPHPALRVERATAVAARIDGDNGLGFVVGTRTMEEAIVIAREHGIGLAFAHRSTHFGMAASYLLQALRAGLAAFAFTNASRAMPVWGGRTAFLGTSPFAFAAPAGGSLDIVLDMATSVTARGKIRRAAQKGEPIEPGLALDAEGRPTTDAKKAYEGVVLPLGGPKGSGLSLMMEILGGVMSGAAFGGDVGNQYVDFDGPQNVGHCFIAIKPDLFMPRDEYAARLDALVERAKGCPTAEGFDEILMPGEPEARAEAARRQGGIPLAAAEIDALVAEAERAGVEVPPALLAGNAGQHRERVM